MNCRALAQRIIVGHKKIYRQSAGRLDEIADIQISGLECRYVFRLKLRWLGSPAIDLLRKLRKILTNWVWHGFKCRGNRSRDSEGSGAHQDRQDKRDPNPQGF